MTLRFQHINLFLLGIAGLIACAACITDDAIPVKDGTEKFASFGPPVQSQLNKVYENIETPESKTLLKELLGKGAKQKFTFLEKLKESFFVKKIAEKFEKKAIHSPPPHEVTLAPVSAVTTESTTEPVTTEMTDLPVVTEAPIPVVTESPVIIFPPKPPILLPKPKFPFPSDCKYTASNGTPPKTFISDVLGNWKSTKKGLSDNSETYDDAIKKIFLTEFRQQFPKEILLDLGLEEYRDIFSNRNESMDLDGTLSLFSKMYTDVLKKLGLETTAFEPNTSLQTESTKQSNKLWAKIGQTTVTPFLEETFTEPCLSNETSLPSADSAMKLILELPLDVTNGLVRRTNVGNDVPLLFEDQPNSDELFAQINAFVNSLSPEVMDEVVSEYVRNKPFVEYIDYGDLEILAKKDLVEYLTLLSFAPIEDLTNHFTNSIKDGLYFTFSLSSIDESITRIPGLTELIERIMQMPKPYLKLLVKKASIIIKTTFKLFAKVDFLKNKVDLIKSKISKPLKMLTTLPFDYTYDIYSLNKRAQRKSDNIDIITTDQSEKSLKSYLGLGNYDLSYDAIVAFLTEFAHLSNDVVLNLFDDLSVRLNPFSGIVKEMYEREQRVQKKMDELYEKYNISNVSKRLSEKLLKLVGLDENSFHVTTTPAPPSFFDKVSDELKRFPDNLLLSFKSSFSWGESEPEIPVKRVNKKIPQESLSAKEFLQVFYNYLNDSMELGKDHKVQLVKMLSSSLKQRENPSLMKQFSSQLSKLGYWFGNTTNEIVGELTNWLGGNDFGLDKENTEAYWKKNNKQDESDLGSKNNLFSIFAPEVSGQEQIKSASLHEKINELEKTKQLFMQRYGFANLSPIGKEEVHNAAKKTSNLVNWNKPLDSLKQPHASFSGLKFKPASVGGFGGFGLPGTLDTKFATGTNKFSKNFETLGVQERSDSFEPEFMKDFETGNIKDLIARYKMLKFPVTLVNNVKKHLINQIKESERAGKAGAAGKENISHWDKLKKKLGYTVPDKETEKNKFFKFRRSVPGEDSAEATAQLDRFFSQENGKAFALQYLSEEDDIPGDSLVAFVAKFFNIR